MANSDAIYAGKGDQADIKQKAFVEVQTGWRGLQASNIAVYGFYLGLSEGVRELLSATDIEACTVGRKGGGVPAK